MRLLGAFGAARTADAQRRFEFRVGVVAIVTTVLSLMAAVGVAVIPFGDTIYRAEFAASGDAKAGDDVRVAGISLGRVRSVSLAGDHVEIAFSLDSKVHVGRDSRVVVKLLTPIGGRYLSVEPKGSGSAAGHLIARDHTKVPYDLSDTFEALPPALQNFDVHKMQDAITKLAAAFDQQPVALNQILSSTNSLSAIVLARKQQLQRAFDTLMTYVDVISKKLGHLQTVGQHILDVYQIVAANRESMILALANLREAFDGITPAADFFNQPGTLLAFHQAYDMIDKAVANLVQDKDELTRLGNNLGPLVTWFAQNSDNPYVHIDQSGHTIVETPGHK